MNKISVKCPAKINLFLNILDKNNNYHKMHMINQSISIYDEVIVNKNSVGINITCDNLFVPTDSSNSVYKATSLFFNKYCINSGVDIKIKKRIPMLSGLGGESSDAAGVLVALNKLYGVNASIQELLEIGFEVGCDVPFCILLGTREVFGYGELLKKYKTTYKYFIVLTPNFSSSTKEMFSLFDTRNIFREVPIEIGHNDFYYVLSDEHKKIINDVKETGALFSFLTGSGSSIVGVYENASLRNKALYELKNKFTNYTINKANSIRKFIIKEFE